MKIFTYILLGVKIIAALVFGAILLIAIFTGSDMD